MIDFNKEINTYISGKDPSVQVYVDCCSMIDGLAKSGGELSTVEEFKSFYLLCLILNDYLFHRNVDSYKVFRNREDYYNDIKFLYDKLMDCHPSSDVLNQVVVELDVVGRRQLSVREILNGNDAGYPYHIFHSYNLTYFEKILVGMRDFVTYWRFVSLVEKGNLQSARDIAEKHLDAIRLIKEWYPGGNKIEGSDKLLRFISMDLEWLTNGKTENGDSFDTAFSKIPEREFKLHVEPTIKLLCLYFETLEKGDYKDYVYYLLRILPATNSTREAIDKKIKNDILEKMQEFSARGFETEEKINQSLKEAEKITNNSARADIYGDLRYKYPYILFDNLDDDTRKYVANGNYVYDIYKSQNNIDQLDFSLPVLEWSKAVENEYRIKLIDPIFSDERICDVLETRYNIQINKLDTLGSSEKLQSAVNFLYDNLYKTIYKDVNVEFFKSLVSQIKSLADYRNKAAHPSDVVLYINDANICQEMVLKSRKILEYMSKLPIIHS